MDETHLVIIHVFLQAETRSSQKAAFYTKKVLKNVAFKKKPSTKDFSFLLVQYIRKDFYDSIEPPHHYVTSLMLCLSSLTFKLTDKSEF